MMAEMDKKFPEEIMAEIKEAEKQRIKVAITDIDGVLRGKFISKKKFLSAAENGFGFCSVIFGWDSFDVCYDNADYTGWHTGYPDAQVKIDLNTFRNIPWDDQTPFFLADFVSDDGEPLAVCPRQLLKKVLDRARASGFYPSAGFEYEWFNFRETPHSVHDKNFHKMEPLSPGMFGYSVLRSSLNKDFFTALMEEMTAFGVPIEGLHTETGPGVLEAAIQYGEPLEAADRASLFKTGCKEIAYRFGILPTFMARWNTALPGCGGHVHQSLWDKDGTVNLFYEKNNQYKMSETFESYLAGQLHCLPDLLPFYAPTVNSYKRLVEGFWAPTRPTWGIDNRTAAFRVIPASEKSTRLEVRVPGADANPYLVLAASVASGIYGIQNKMKLTNPPVTGNAYEQKNLERLPRDLHQATLKLAESKLAIELFGEKFVKHFVQSRDWEWRQFSNSVSDWELKRYFEII